jgi:hypothetical protein
MIHKEKSVALCDSNDLARKNPAKSSTSLYLSENTFKEPAFDVVAFVDRTTRQLIRQQTNETTSHDKGESDDEDSDELFVGASSENAFDLDLDLDPSWYNAFNILQHALIELKARVGRSVSQLTKDCAHRESALRNKINELSRQVENLFSVFNDVDSRVTRVSNEIVRVGGSLESIEVQRARAVEAELLLRYIVTLNDPSQSLPPNLSDPNLIRHENAILVKKLSLIAGDLDLPSTQTAQSAIRSLYKSVETSLLQRFAGALETMQLSVLRETAHTLFAFNGGESCVTMYFTHFFAHRLELPQIEWLADANIAETLTTHLNSIARAVCKEYEDVVKCVFPDPSYVATQLIQRVRDVHFRSAIDSAIQRCDSHSERTLRVCMEAVQCIAKIAISFARLAPNITSDILLRPLFTSYLSQYAKWETFAMTVAFADTAVAFTTRASPPPTSPLLSSALSSLSSYVPLTGDLLLPFFERLEVAITRANTLSFSESLATNVYRIFSTFLREVGFKYIYGALEAAMNHMLERENAESRSSEKTRTSGLEEDGIATYFRVVTVVNTFAVMTQKTFYLQIKPHVETSRNEYTLCVTEKNKLLLALEECINEGIRRALKLFHARMKAALRLQQKRDFHTPKDANLEAVSRACQEVCALIRHIHTVIVNTLDGDNVTVLLRELATLILDTLLKHVAKFNISQGEGSLALLRDMKAYIETMERFGSKVVEQFEVLEAVAKLHLVAPSQLPSLIRETSLRSLPSTLLQSFIAQRQDYSSHWWGQLLPKTFE